MPIKTPQGIPCAARRESLMVSPRRHSQGLDVHAAGGGDTLEGLEGPSGRRIENRL